MEENNDGINLVENNNTVICENNAVPAQVTVWSKIKSALLYEVKIELTPKQEKVFKEVSEFWHQDVKDISFKGLCQLFKFN